MAMLARVLKDSMILIDGRCYFRGLYITRTMIEQLFQDHTFCTLFHISETFNDRWQVNRLLQCQAFNKDGLYRLRFCYLPKSYLEKRSSMSKAELHQARTQYWQDMDKFKSDTFDVHHPHDGLCLNFYDAGDQFWETAVGGKYKAAPSKEIIRYKWDPLDQRYKAEDKL
jgi:hypothetical protein